MVNYLHNRLRSERGASISYALFVFLVCCAVSSIVLAAATASSGQFAELSKFDQHYYSVTSAASLFQSELDGDGEAAYAFTDVLKGDDGEERTSKAINYVVDPGAFSVVNAKTGQPIEKSADKFMFLYDMTVYALYGSGSAGSSEASAFDTDTHGWPSKGYQTFEYSVTPSIPGEHSGIDMGVTAEVRLHDDWTAEVVLSNNATEATDKFSVYLSFAGNMEEDTSMREVLDNTTVSGAKVENDVAGTKEHTTTVTWRLKQLVPGRGFAND